MALPQSPAAAWIARNQRAIGLIVDASSMKCFRFDSPKNALVEQELPRSYETSPGGEAHRVGQRYSSGVRRRERALDECRRGIRFFTGLLDSDCNFLLMTMVTMHCRKLLTASFNRITQGRDLETSVLSEWIERLDEDEWRKHYFSGIKGEGVFSLEWGLANVAGVRETLEGQDKLTKGYSRFRNWLIRPLLKFQVIGNLEVSRRLDRLRHLSYHRQKAYFEAQGPKGGALPWYRKPLGQWLPDFRYVFMKEAALEAMMLATKSGLACKVYKNKYGRYPDSLDALVPGILDAVPIDPFTGKPLVYKLTADEVLIYSFGSNETDDGGRQRSETGQLVMEKDDDWAWREKIR